MKKIISLICLVASVYITHAQSQSVQEMLQTANSFIKATDYDNAFMVLKAALQKEPNNYAVHKQIMLVHYYKREFAEAIELGKKTLENPASDEQCFQIMGLCYNAINDASEAKKMYKKAIKKFPKSGVLHNEFGELLAANNNMNDAIEIWEKGIEADPNYSTNYYNAAMYHINHGNYFKVIVLGELFVNLESYTAKTQDIKNALFDAYKKVYTGNILQPKVIELTKNKFEKAVLETLVKSKSLSLHGITPNQLLAIRTRFILDWFASNKQTEFPFRLFDQNRLLLREGLFEAYNQWLFGIAYNGADFQKWVAEHDDEVKQFKTFQEGRVFKAATNEVYLFQQK